MVEWRCEICEIEAHDFEFWLIKIRLAEGSDWHSVDWIVNCVVN
jgi:hypothetical protein